MSSERHIESAMGGEIYAECIDQIALQLDTERERNCDTGKDKARIVK